MKHFLKALCIALFALLVLSCGDTVNEHETNGGTMAYLSISVGSVNARTIFPEEITLADDTLSFSLTGTSGTNSIEKTWTNYADMTADETILLETGTWNFTLEITRNGADILKSTVSTDIAAGENVISFTDWQEYGTGSVSVTLTFPAGKKVSVVRAGLFDLDGNATEDCALESLVIADTADENGTAQQTVTYEKEGVPVGYHRVRFLFYTEAEADITESTAPVARDSDIVLVARNLTSQATRTLSAFNTAYEIAYVYPENMPAEKEITSPVRFTENETVALPVTAVGTYKPYFYPEFYREEDYSGEKVTGWNAKEVTGDQTLYVKWVTDTSYLEGALDSAIKNDYPLHLTGEINSDTIETIKSSAATLCTDGKTLSLDLKDTTGLSEIYQTFLNWIWLRDVVIPKGLTTIGNSAFNGCSSLESVVIPNSVTRIGDRVFLGCSSLESVVIPNSVTRIGEQAFMDCSSLASVVIPNSVTSIGFNLFQRCSNLTSVKISNNLTRIENYAFEGCSSLTSVEIPNSVTTIGSGAFNGCSSLESVVIPDSVTSIEMDAFYYCPSLISITIPSSVTSIGSGAFNVCRSLESVVIPNNVTTIEDTVFSECSGLTSVEIPSGVTSIGNSAFSYCSDLTSVVIPSGVTTIGAQAFYECEGLTSVTIPNSVTSIGESAFSNCKGLNTVYYTGSENDWKAITIGTDNTELTNATIHYAGE